MSNNHVLALSPSEMNISSYTQELMCYMGQHLVFSSASEVLQTTIGVVIDAKQIERICHYYGEQIEEQDAEKIETDLSADYSQEDKNHLHYAMVDGAMYLTREDKWKEAKLGRIFKANDNIDVSDQRGIITNST